MTYRELVEDFNKDLKALEQIEKPVMVYKEEKQMMAEKEQKQEETLKKVSRVVWPMWTLIFIINTALAIAYQRQKVQIERNSLKIEAREKFNSYSYK